MAGVLNILALFFNALQLLILVYVLGSWIPSITRYGWFRTVRDIVEPMLRPFRRILPPSQLGGLDISPIFLILVLGIIQRVLFQLLAGSVGYA